jgi:hypothetical protein
MFLSQSITLQQVSLSCPALPCLACIALLFAACAFAPAPFPLHPQASLKPRFQAKEVDNEDCKWLLGKVVAKVMDATTGADTEAAEFMTAKRITKVNALIDGYLTKRKADKKAGLAGDADKRQAGKVSATAKTP